MEGKFLLKKKDWCVESDCKTGLVKNRQQAKLGNSPNETVFILWAGKKFQCLCVYMHTYELAWKYADWEREPAYTLRTVHKVPQAFLTLFHGLLDFWSPQF